MNSFIVRQVQNGWIVADAVSYYTDRNGVMANEYVFATLDEMNAWLKAKYEPADLIHPIKASP